MTEYIKGLAKERLISGSQAITNAWADIGPIIETYEFVNGLMWIKVDIGSSTDVQFRLQARLSDVVTDDEYSYPIKSVSASLVKVEDEVFELDADIDQNIVIGFQTDGIVPYLQLQVKDSAGGTGLITGLTITKSKNNDRICS